MKLFEIDPNTQLVQLNKVWIQLIPEFSAIIKRDKGSPGDYDGRFKLRARREFTFIYHMKDFNSPLRYWEPHEKRVEALRCAEMAEKDVDEKITEALQQYEKMMLRASRALRTYRSLEKGLDEFDNMMENIDFTKTDKQGRPFYSPDDFVKNTINAQKMYDALRNFERMVEEDLTQDTGIQGNKDKGENEGVVKPWSEIDIKEGSEEMRAKSGKVTKGGPNDRGRTMDGLSTLIHKQRPVALSEREDFEENGDSGYAFRTNGEVLESYEGEEEFNEENED